MIPLRCQYVKVVQPQKKHVEIRENIDNAYKFSSIAKRYRNNRRNQARNTELQIINKFNRKSVKKTIKIKIKNVVQDSSSKNKKIEKLKRNPKAFFKDSKILFLKPLHFLFKDRK